MNDHFKTLLLQAGFTNAYADSKDGFELVFVDENHTLESVTKFAELIVQECILKIHGARIRSESYNELIERIEQDFGV